MKRRKNLKTLKDFNVGDKLFYIPNDRRHANPNGVYLEVTKVGRKFTYVDDMKVTAWDYNGYAIGNTNEWPHGTFYETEQDYLDMKEWNNFILNVPKLSRKQKTEILNIVNGV